MVLLLHFIWGPATFVVLLIVGLLILLGALLLGRSRGDPEEPHTGDGCPKCGHRNPTNARYCARCGHELREIDEP